MAPVHRRAMRVSTRLLAVLGRTIHRCCGSHSKLMTGRYQADHSSALLTSAFFVAAIILFGLSRGIKERVSSNAYSA